MRKSSAVLLYILLGSAAAGAGVIEKTYSFSGHRIAARAGYEQLFLPNTSQRGLVGEPVLPFQGVMLALPPGEAAASVELVTEDGDLVSLPQRLQMYPRQPDRRLSDQTAGSFARSGHIYAQTSVYPESVSCSFRTAYMNGAGVVLASFTPVRYVPASGETSYFSKVTLRIRTEPVSAKAGPPQLASEARRKLARTVQNPDVLAGYADASFGEDGYELLIISGSDYLDRLGRLTGHYAYRGMRVRLTAVEDIDTSIFGRDLQEKIRNYILQEYQDHGIVHVLLGGDVEIVPARGFYCYVDSDAGYYSNNIPADLYYSALDGSWDSNGNNSWGEIGEEDLLPDVSVGRLPFSSQAELARMLAKITAYQNAPVPGRLKHPLLVGEKAWDNPLSWGADYLELLVGERSDNGYSTVGIPEDHPVTTLYDRDAGTWSKTRLIEVINAGHSSLYHSGHSNTYYNMRMSTADVTEANFLSLDGVTGNYLTVYSHGCNSGAFDADVCIGEKMLLLENFAVSYIGNSRYGWFNEGQTEGPSLHLNREYVSALYGDSTVSIGEAHMISKIRSAPWVTAPNQHEEGALRWCVYACNVLGDPAMPVWTDEPVSVDAAYETVFNKQTGVLNVHLTSGGAPLSGYVCALVQDSTLYGSARTDAGGNAVIELRSLSVRDGSAVLAVSGYNCPPVHLPLTVTGIGDDQAGLPDKLQIAGNYPNPFNMGTRIVYRLPGRGHVTLQIYNLGGQLVSTLVDRIQNGGTHTVFWDGSDLNGRTAPSGIYFCRAAADGFSDTSRLLLVK